ncbi:ATP SYNTHASE GAMMA CHAIN [Mycoplasmopsis pulmonis]|uniref:ATP synthase gamma chain n=1 Tax=Mycoplasmopsis pulmonis (strain UAB CTIP) TaxID=272635 RepID=ATPG_MYCPU|nr:ATP synthase F1 subunit gamma [Mycoplasmopsis pulmonis]Q98QU4.1 RecName: Full=ATP synthase gamma chain; AltName: Full=ATP synthase F1 sector gamma subunit; AltName: Full=F-ATPase gamma subunit [Mycoplasmopsis pulmonis UAB CTIP]MDZ7293226.1 ATP synthase F1 subunit gamma [Mycoplasmopsis pulmonis]CAC13440.1 ATP SYNTHASE GAMMA CHAIN [Mycoplasmopsis pulmonis]VEU68028.1 ATP synthase F0F1 subunit gamma [Mycoplasmopsis pulmonis]
MPSLQKTKNRIALIDNIKKITKAMELVATSKMKKTQKHFLEVNEFSQSVLDIFSKIVSQIDPQIKLYPDGQKNSTLYIVISSDIGLAGSYNSNIFKILNSNIKNEDKLILIGQKAINFFSNRQDQIIETFKALPDYVTYKIAKLISDSALNSFLNKDVNQIKVVYTKFINLINQQEKISTILPIKKNPMKSEIKENAILEFEPDVESVFHKAIPLYLASIIFGFLTESKVSELAARRTAMESASKNAIDLIGNLKIEYNQTRQAKITQEISEIVAGSVE